MNQLALALKEDVDFDQFVQQLRADGVSVIKHDKQLRVIEVAGNRSELTKKYSEIRFAAQVYGPTKGG